MAINSIGYIITWAKLALVNPNDNNEGKEFIVQDQ